jgi:SAM-dependent methyltransferase
MQSVINLKVKYREGFRPFAPAVLRERAPEFFDVREIDESPYMLLVAPVKDEKRRPLAPDARGARGIAKLHLHRSDIPAVTHVDYSARIQTVDPERHGLYRRLIEAFERQTGCPVLVNTSFNLGWEPIVCAPEEAYRTFMSSDIDVLALGPFVLSKKQQPAERAAAARRVGAGLAADVWTCPCGRGGALEAGDGGLVGAVCGHQFRMDQGIPRLLWPAGERSKSMDGVGDSVPGYDGHEGIRAHIDWARRRPYGRQLDAALPYNARILELGCGTGNLANFIGIGCREVIGTDLSLAALRVAEAFRTGHSLDRVRFAQMNPRYPTFRPGTFDVVVCTGGLGWADDPAEAIRALVPLLRTGGRLILPAATRRGRALERLRARIRGDRGPTQWPLGPVIWTDDAARCLTAAGLAAERTDLGDGTFIVMGRARVSGVGQALRPARAS